MEDEKKFEITVVGQNMFMIIFDEEVVLESILEGRPWFFRKHLVTFERLTETINRCKVKLVSSSFWVKIGPCPFGVQ